MIGDHESSKQVADSANVVPFRKRPRSADDCAMEISWGDVGGPGVVPLDLDHFALPGGGADLHAYVAARMHEAVVGSADRQPVEWVAEARDHLRAQVDGLTTGGVTVSATGLHLALAYIDHLEELLSAWTAGASA